MRQAGFVDLRSSWAGKEFLFESAPDFWDAQAAIVTDVRKRMLLAEPEAIAAMKAEFLL